MSLGQDDADRLAHALTETEFDAVERDGLRAAWNEEGTQVVVTDLDDQERVVYTADDLVRATSDSEVRDAREPTPRE